MDGSDPGSHGVTRAEAETLPYDKRADARAKLPLHMTVYPRKTQWAPN